LKGGGLVVGQHRLTGKEAPPLRAAIDELFLIRSLNAGDPTASVEPVEVAVKPKVRDLIGEADVICYPYGSYYTSLLANLLPRGVGEAVRRSGAPKVFVPNPAGDPEQVGMSLYDSVTTLIRYLERSADAPAPVERLVSFVVVDTKRVRYPRPLKLRAIRELGIQVIDTRLVTDEDPTRFDDRLVARVLLSLT
jgi:2-phospho-L-lactate transferase/gluconeogenesis factor (CofD/UPF0052 family)